MNRAFLLGGSTIGLLLLSRQLLWGFGSAIDKDGSNDQAGSKTELQVDLEVEQINCRNGGNYDADRCGKALENVVCVLDHHSDGETAECLQANS